MGMAIEAMASALALLQSAVEPLLGAQSFWVAIVLLTVAVRVLMLPLAVRQARSVKAMRALAPQLEKLQRKYRNKPQKLNEARMALLRAHNVNPLLGCLTMLVQSPVLYVLFQTMRTPVIDGVPNLLAGKAFVFGVSLDAQWLELAGLAAKLASPEGLTILALALLVGLLTYLTLRRPGSELDAGLGGGATGGASGQVAVVQRSMRAVMPVLSAGFAVSVPLAVVLYLVTSSAWTYAQQLLLFR